MTRPSYESFLASKREIATPVGFGSAKVSDQLFPFQRDIVRWACARGRAAIFADCGLGKTPMQLEWARQVHWHTSRRVLILAPLAVSSQTQREGEKFGIDVTACRDASDVRDGINVTNYERLHRFDPASFGAIVLDECFAPSTNVEVFRAGCLTRLPIRDIRVGDEIPNAAGRDVVADVHRREVPYAVRVRFAGSEVIVSPNHPFFTSRGYVGAQDLKPGDSLVPTAEAMRLVRDVVPEEVGHAAARDQVLRSILLSEMANAPAGDRREGALSGGRGETWGESLGMVSLGESEGAGGARAHSHSEPQHSARSAGEDLPPIERDRARTFRAWGQRSWFDAAASDLAGCARTELDTGICFVTGSTDSRLSDALQARLSVSRAANRHRGGWVLAPLTESAGREEGREARFTRVDSLEVLEPGHPDLERLRAADGKLYFYDLGATRHPSFSVAGHLVHNSSILKGFDGTMRKEITDFARAIHYRLACTATPAPNDLIEITNHAEFLDVMSGKEILALFFKQDGNTTHAWRLKGHAREDFWRWMASWSVALRKPSDLGYPDDDFILPPLAMHEQVVAARPVAGELFATHATSLADVRAAQRESLAERVERCAALVNASDEPWIVWCNLNAESDALARAMPDAVNVRGSDSAERKEQALLDFVAGKTRVLVSKPTLCGFGMNFQHCANVAFVGLSYSYEQFYQAIRRCWRFGQKRPVHAHLVIAENEGAVKQAIERKEKQSMEMMAEIVERMAGLQLEGQKRDVMEYREDIAEGDGWQVRLGDVVKRIRELDDDSVGLTVTSPPFPGMYAYTNSPHDIGNVKSLGEAIEHLRFLIPELLRVTMPGRSCCLHLTQAVAFKGTDGYIGVKDFRGAMIRAMEDAGWVYYGEVAIDKDPQVKAIRTKDRGLLFKTLATESAHMHMALADYLLQFRKPGENPRPIRAGISEKYDNADGWITPEEWIEWAAPVWYRARPEYPGGIRETDVLQVAPARDDDDEKHLCPLQLGVIERAVKLWSAPGDLVLDPFNGIGSTGYVSLKLNRRYAGFELKESYWRVALKNLARAVNEREQRDLFSGVA